MCFPIAHIDLRSYRRFVITAAAKKTTTPLALANFTQQKHRKERRRCSFASALDMNRSSSVLLLPLSVICTNARRGAAQLNRQIKRSTNGKCKMGGEERETLALNEIRNRSFTARTHTRARRNTCQIKVCLLISRVSLPVGRADSLLDLPTPGSGRCGTDAGGHKSARMRCRIN